MREPPDGVPGKKHPRQPCHARVSQENPPVKAREKCQFTNSGLSPRRKKRCSPPIFELTTRKSALRKYFFSDNPAPPGAPPAGGGGREDAGGRTPAGGSKPGAGARRAEKNAPHPRPKKRPARAAGGRGGSGRDPCPGGGASAPPPGTRCTSPKAARSKGDRTGSPQRSKAGGEGRRAQRAPTERDSAHTGRARAAGGSAQRGAQSGPAAPKRTRHARHSRSGARADAKCAKRPPTGAKAGTPQRVWARWPRMGRGPRWPGWGPAPGAGPRDPGHSQQQRSAIYGAQRG